MKTTIFDRICKARHTRGPCGPTAPLLGGLAVAITLVGTGLKAQVLKDTKSVLLVWPQPVEEQIVVGSDTPDGPVWTPWPEPIFKRFGQMCMTVPTTASEQYFKLVRGRQFLDDFSDAWGPFTNRNSWVAGWYEPEGEGWVVTNGVLQLNWSWPWWSPFTLQPLGTNVEANLRDFYTSVDILDWVISGTNHSALLLFGRGIVVPSGAGKAYFGGLALNVDGIPGQARLALILYDTIIRGPNFNIQEKPLPYRVQLSTVGNDVSLRVLSLTTGQLVGELHGASSVIPYGFAGIETEGTTGADSYKITLDNYGLFGTK